MAENLWNSKTDEKTLRLVSLGISLGISFGISFGISKSICQQKATVLQWL